MNAYDIKSEILGEISSYKSKFPKISLNNIAKKAGKSETTLRKILDFRNTQLPRPETVLKILMVLHKNKSMIWILRNGQGKLGEYLRNNFPMILDDPAEPLEQPNRELMAWQKCPICNGSGLEEENNCSVCLGRKIISVASGLPPFPISSFELEGISRPTLGHGPMQFTDKALLGRITGPGEFEK